MQESLEASLVRIHTADGRVVGAGFLVGERHILTCAHVVSQTLDLGHAPLDAPQGLVSLDFPLLPPCTLCSARVVLWCPPLSDGRGDIAGLELQGEPPAGTEMVRFAPAEDVWEHPFRTFGFPSGYDDGVWATGRLLGRQATDWVMIEDIKAQGFAVGPGFSGTPVWDTQLQGVVGMVVAASRLTDLKAAFVLPLDVLVAAWPLIEPVTRQRIFLSAAPTDADLAARLTSDLEARDIVVWTEQHTPGEEDSDKEERIRQTIRAAQAVVLVVSSQTRSSRTIKEHLRLADLYQRRLILVWVGDDEHAQPQYYGWRETIWVDAHSTQYAAVLDAIETNLSQRRSISDLLGLSQAGPEQEPRNPYKGLRAFTADDAGDFFGRDRLVDELIKDIGGMQATGQATNENGRLLTIIGPSGSGKSSVVMAGLLPKLRDGALPGSEAWVYLEPMVPGKHPIEALILTLKSHFPDTSFKTLQEDMEDDATRGLHLLATQLVKRQESTVVLLVDQFEELFTQTELEEERGHFIDLLQTATTEPRGPLLVLLTLRADFYDRLLQYPELYHLVKTYQQPMFPMEIDDLRATIEQPAALPDVQITFEGNLIGDLLFEMQGQVGVLPLLQFTLEQLFQRRSGHRLTLQAYREIGGVKGALSQHAEKTYATLPSEEHRRLARALFVRLIDPGATEQDTTRRRAALSEFTLADATQTRLMRETIDSFIAARLVTTNEVAETTTIEVSHEAVIREWKRLAEWMREARQDIPLQQTISQDTTEWEQRKKAADRLYRGSQLKDAQAWARRNMPSESEATFLRVSAAHRTRSRVGVVTSCILVVLLLLFTGFQNREVFFPPDPTLVTTLADNGPGSLRQAVLTAKSGSTIRFDTHLRGVIKLVSNISIDRDLTIRGPGASILSISGSGGFNVLLVEPWASVIISGLAFRETNQLHKGFGIVINDGTLTLTNITVSGNSTYDGAGGITNNYTGTLTINNSTISGNKSTISSDKSIGGGGIGNEGTLLLNNCTISDNTTNTGGGGISNTGTLTLTNSTISHNTSSGGWGGGIGNYGGSLTISNSRIFGNTAFAGAGIFNNGGPLTLSNSTVSDNTADNGGYGGGIHNVNGTLTLTNSTVSDNTAGYGGGINNGYSYGDHAFDDVLNHGGPLTLTNSTISDNRATEGSGILENEDSHANIIFCTIYDNAATSEGGGIAIVAYKSNRSGQVKMRNNLVAGNHAPTAPDISGTLTSDGYNLVQDISGANFAPNQQHSTDVSVDPHVDLKIDSQLRDNGGLTTSHTFTHALLPISPAIDKIPLSACHPNGISTDQRGMKRPDKNEPFCDIGAYEYQDAPT